MRPMQFAGGENALRLVGKAHSLHVPTGFQPIRCADGMEYLVPEAAVREGRRSLGRRRTIDSGMLTYDRASHMTVDAHGNQLGKPLGQRYQTHDGKTVDSTGAFLVGELERLDLTMHMPLAAVTWGRDMELREDVTIADEVSSFTVSTFGSPGGLGTGQQAPTGISWIGKITTAIPRISVDIAKVVQPLSPWAEELAYTILELESAAKVGRPIDDQKWKGLQLKHQMDIDQMVYVGDTGRGFYGLLNSNLRTDQSQVTALANAPNGAQGTPQWTTKTPAEILADFNLGVVTAWANAAFAVIPNKQLIPNAQFGFISTQLVSAAGTTSILKYVKENNVLAAAGLGLMDIQGVKWCLGAGVGGTLLTSGTVDRMVTYSQDRERIRYPMTMLQNTPLQYNGIWHQRTSFCRLGVTEIVYPETIDYLDGI
jgi:hypothetical protein